MTMLLLVLWLGTAASPTQSMDLSGVWLRDAADRPAFEDAAPAWEEITVDATQVTIRRASRPQVIETYRFDGTERQTARVRANRFCRAAWQEATLVLNCREVDGGPGGLAPAITTREMRSIDAQGRLVVETRWSSGDQVVTRRERYRRQQ